ncbi:amidohydrolase family protein [Mucilaginibacter mali]|uniref:Amidohydrolase family protein n=1 Tax=Mucilaginibacter mali TaxID=2740462 RepID=A0A7D4UP75_9SPHI|nr:amidohydrolase family protein [Mucilaginibacter mali]QKJ29940.1 amidohydrolase family protein [Mucilaginibacter mali]
MKINRFFLVALLSGIWFIGRGQNYTPQVAAYIKFNEAIIAITNVKLIDGTGNPAKSNQTIIIRNGKIEQVGDAAKIKLPDNIKTIDGTGKTLIPGLVMLHEHMYYTMPAGNMFNIAQMPYSFPRLYLAGGATTIRTAGSIEPQTDLNIKRMIADGKMLGPDMDVTAPYIEEQGYDIPGLNVIKGPEEAAATVNFWADRGCTSFKMYVHATKADMAAVVREAHKRKLKVTGHIGAVTYREAAEIGIDNLEHGFMASGDFDSLKVENAVDDNHERQSLMKLDVNSPKMKDLMKFMIGKHVALTSTLTVFEPSTSREVFPGGADEALTPEVREMVQKKWQAAQNRDQASAALFAKEQAWEKQYVAMGGLLVAGTDPTGAGRVVSGYSNHREIELLVEGGFTPEQAIKICTLNGAMYLGRQGDIGSIAPGKKADLVLLNGDLSADIKNIRKTDMVFKNGAAFDSQKIFDSVKGHVGMN